MTETYLLKPIGWVKQEGGQVVVEVESRIARPSWVWSSIPMSGSCSGFTKTTTPGIASILQVHPCRNPGNPLAGVFAARAPVRPNLIGLSAARLVGWRAAG